MKRILDLLALYMYETLSIYMSSIKKTTIGTFIHKITRTNNATWFTIIYTSQGSKLHGAFI